MSEETTAQSNDNAVNNPTTEGSKNNDVPYDRFQEVNTQKKDFASQLEEANAKLANYEKEQENKRQKRLEQEGEYKTLLTEKDAQIERLTKVETAYNERDTADRERYMERLSDADKEFGEGMDTSKLRKFSENRVQNPNAGKTSSQRQGVTPNGGEFGGYGSYEEWASKDPTGCEKHLEQSTIGFIK